MKPKMICDSCTDELKQIIENEDNVYVIDDRVKRYIEKLNEAHKKT